MQGCGGDHHAGNAPLARLRSYADAESLARTPSSGTAELLAEVNALGGQPPSARGGAKAGPDGRSHATVRDDGFDLLD